jgi:prophage DNA circulation protein
MSATKTKKTTKTKATRKAAKSTRKATSEALASVEANIEAIDGAGKKRKAKKVKEAKPKKLSALDAAAQVLAESGEPMNTREMIETLAAKKLWTSPGGKTPHATLYSAILREINEKGEDARFVKTERGKFAANAA